MKLGQVQELEGQTSQGGEDGMEYALPWDGWPVRPRELATEVDLTRWIDLISDE